MPWSTLQQGKARKGAGQSMRQSVAHVARFDELGIHGQGEKLRKSRPAAPPSSSARDAAAKGIRRRGLSQLSDLA
jgi:hypothetical protein